MQIHIMLISENIIRVVYDHSAEKPRNSIFIADESWLPGEPSSDTIPLSYTDQDKALTFGTACGEYKYQEHFIIKLIENGQIRKILEFTYKGIKDTISL